MFTVYLNTRQVITLDLYDQYVRVDEYAANVDKKKESVESRDKRYLRSKIIVFITKRG